VFYNRYLEFIALGINSTLITFLWNSGRVKKPPKLMHAESSPIPCLVGYELLFPETFPEAKQVVDEQGNVLQTCSLIHRNGPQLVYWG